MSRWFHARGREKLGPFTLAELQLRAQQGELQPSDMLLEEGTPQWKSASGVAGLFLEPTLNSAASIPETLATASPDDPHSTAIPTSSAPLRDPGLPDMPGYELLGLLGKGGMGVVYKARHIALNRLVALKMILTGSHAGSEERKRFFSEAESVARLRHPNIVQVYDVGEHGGVPFFSLEFCDGGSLDKRIAGTPQRAREAAELCETLARAMSAAHQAGIVHRDLKPANVLLASRGRESLAEEEAGDSRPRLAAPKITDFGLAKQLEAEGVTQSGAVMGTPSYMAPEQARGESKNIGPAADIYALGAILYELLTGRVPFKGASAPDTLLLVTTAEPVPPRQLVPGVPRDLETICLKCLQKEPLRRYLTAQALADDLRRFLDGRPIAARPVGSLERLGRWTKRNPALAAVTLLLLLTFVIGFSGIVWKWREAVSNYEEKEKQRELATQNADKANTQRELAELRELEAKRFVYTSFMNQLPDAWRAGDLAGVQRYLDAFLPKPDDREDVRGFEWHHYWKRSQGSRLTLFGHGGEVGRLAFFPDSATLVSASRDQTIAFWDTATGTMKKSVFHGLISDLTVSPDGKLLAYCYSGLADVKNVDRWQTMGTYGKGEPYFAAFSGNGKVLAIAGKVLLLVQVIDASTPLVERSATSLEGQTVRAMAISPDGKTLVTGDYSGQLILWDVDPANLAAGPKKRATVKAHSGKVQSVALTRDSSMLVSVGEDTLIRFNGIDRTAGTFTAFSTLRYHKGAINALALTRDDKTLISAGKDGIIRLWDIPGKRNRGELRGHSRAVTALAVSPDGKQLASAGVDSCIKLWDLTHLPEQTARGTSVNALAFSPTEPLLASAGDDGLVKLWDTRTREVKATLAGHPGPVKGVAFTPDGKTLVTGGGDEWLRLWDVATGQERDRLEAVDAVTALAVSPDGSLLATGSARGWFTLHSLQSRKRQKMIHPHDERISSVVFAPDSKSVALTSWDRYISIYDIVRNQPHRRSWLHHQPVRSAFFTEDGKHLFATGYSGNPVMMDPLSPAGGSYLTGDNINFAVVGAIAPGGKTVYWGTHFATAGTLLVSEPPAGTGTVFKVTGIDFASAVNTHSLAVSPDGRLVALGSDDGVVTLYETAPMKPVARLPAHTHAVTAVACSPDGKTYAHGKPDFTVVLTDADSRAERRVLRGHTHIVSAVAFSPDSKTIATASHDKTVRLWDGVTGQERGIWRDFKYPVLALAFSPDQQTLAVSTGRIDVGGEFTLREVSTGRVRSTLKGHHATVRGMAFAPDGKTLASVSGDGWHLPGEIKIWDADTGKELATRSGHPGPIFSVAYAPDGRTLATAGDDEMVRLWDVSNPARLLAQGPQFPGHKGKVYSLAFSPDGRTLASAGEDGAIRFWQPTLGQPLGLLPGKDAVHSLAFAPHASALLAGSEKELVIYPAATAQELAEARSRQTDAPLPLDLPAETDRILAQARVKYAADEDDPKGLQDAAKLLEELEKRHPNPQACRRDRAEVLLRLAESLSDKDTPKQESLSRQALALIEPLAREGSAEDRLLLGRALEQTARELVRQPARREECEQLVRKAATVFRELLEEDPDNETYRDEAVNISMSLGIHLAVDRQVAEARKVLAEGIRLLDDSHAKHASTDHSRMQLAEFLEKLLQVIDDDSVERTELTRRLVALRHLLWTDSAGAMDRLEDRARAWLLRGNALLDSNLESADSFFKSAVGEFEYLASRKPVRPMMLSSQAEAIHGQADVLYRKKKMKEAEAAIVQAITLQKKVRAAPAHEHVAQFQLARHLSLHARLLLAQGRHADAAVVVEERLTLNMDLMATWGTAAELLGYCSHYAGLDTELPADQRAKKAKEYADRAMQLLEKMVKNGYRNLTELEQSPGLDSLRMRDDFKALLQKLREK